MEEEARGDEMYARRLRLSGWLGWGILLGLLLYGAFLRYDAGALALADSDSWGWLGAALHALGGDGLRETFEREWLYGAFVSACLWLTGSFSGLVVVQHLLGLAAALLMWVTWRFWSSSFPRRLLLDVISPVFGLFAVFVFLQNPSIIVLEMSIRPEAILTFCGISQLLCVSAYCHFRWRENRPGRATAFGALAVVLAYVLFVLKPNWALAMPLTTWPVFAGMIGSRRELPARLAAPVAGIVLAIMAVWLPGRLLLIRSPETHVVLPMTLFTIHADIIRESMRAELASSAITPERKHFLIDFLSRLDRELAKAKIGKIYYDRLGFDPDYLMYRSSLFPALEQQGMSRADIASFCRESFLSALAREPGGYARKVGRQFAYFVFPDRVTFYRRRIDLAPMAGNSLHVLPEALPPYLSPSTRALYDSYRERLVRASVDPRDISGLRVLQDVLETWSFLALPVVLVFALCALASLSPAFSAYRFPALLSVLFFSAPSGNALTIALVHALDNSRFRSSYGMLLLFALTALSLYIVAFACETAVRVWAKIRRKV